jgi:uncharacterized protein
MSVVHNAARHRFELTTPNGTAVADYRLTAGQVEFYHTEVPTADRKQGLGGELATAALQWAAAEGLRVEPTCPFIRAHLEQHPELGATP